LESFAFNVAVARIYEFANAIADADKTPEAAGMGVARHEAIATLARLIAPMMPHLAEEIFSRLPGSDGLLAENAWPEADAELAAAQSVTIAIQIMGKLRGTIVALPGAPAEGVIAAAEADPRIASLLEGKRIVKRIHVPDRIVNFVVAG
jgi:leucyl-tRNA synthetase